MIEIKEERHEMYEMAAVGDLGQYEIYVNTNDGGKTPHVHYRKKDNWKEFHTCIKLLESDYFFHEGKEDMFNSGQRKEFQEFMESPVKISRYAGKFENNWELACFMWDLNNSDVVIPDNAVMPNYRNLLDKK